MKKVFLITLLLVSYLSYGQVNLDDGLVLYYPFNGNANDESGNNHDGVVSGASLTSDKFSNSSKAYLFDGINDNITIWNSSETNANVNTDSGAISVWINPKNAGFVYQYYASNNDRFYLHLLPSLPGYRIGFGNEYIEVIEEIDFNSTIWYNFTINYYSNGNVKVYFDGGLSATYTYTNPGFIFGGGENFYLGQGWSQNRSNYEEKIDEFRLYNRPLNTDEIESLFNLTDGGGTPSITTLIVDGAAASATLSAGESHWYQFEVTTSGEHYIETHGSTDMYMVLYQNDGTTQITYDDDSGENTNSKITRDLTVGWYKVEMSGYSSSVTGDYT
ncbi:MAG: LamG domain-containing protein, partial [Mariniphaga sp.]|nr:LamG domain-containing protein [Mariniphaga sp.]